jgi:ribosomal protein S10
LLRVTHSLKFVTLYIPASVKNIRLIFRTELNNSSFLNNKDKAKVLVKQSYVILAWLHYLGTRFSSKSVSLENQPTRDYTNTNLSEKSIMPGLFVYPTKSYKTTLTKAPMAHKTFSQEQFMFKTYKISVSFNTDMNSSEGGYFDKNEAQFKYINNINFSMYYIALLRTSIPYISTNMLLLKRYTLGVSASDAFYFSYFFFNE